jgi:hypothetical protein
MPINGVDPYVILFAALPFALVTGPVLGLFVVATAKGTNQSPLWMQVILFLSISVVAFCPAWMIFTAVGMLLVSLRP